MRWYWRRHWEPLWWSSTGATRRRVPRHSNRYRTSRLPPVPVAAGATTAAEYSPLLPELTALDFSGLSAAYPALSAPPGPMGIARPAPQLSFGSEWAAPVLARLRDMHVESQPAAAADSGSKSHPDPRFPLLIRPT